MKKILKVLIIILSLILVITYFSFASSQGIDHTKKIIKIGWFGPLTGLFQRIGEGMIDGMKAYIDLQNSNNTLNSYKVLLITYDNNMDPILTKQVYQKLVQEDRVFALVGALGSIGVNAVLTDMATHGIPVVYLGGGETHWAVPPKRNIFPVQPDYITEGGLMTRFAIENLNAKRLAFIYHTGDNTGRTALNGVRRAMSDFGRKKGAVMVLEMQRLAVNVVIAKIKDANPEAVILFDFFGSAAGLISAAKRAGINTKWVTSYVNSDSSIYQMSGTPWLGTYIAGWGKATGQSAENFLKFFVKTPYHNKAVSRRWDSPSGYNIAGWIACEIFYGGLKLFLKQNNNDMSKLTWDKFIKAMESMRNFNDSMAKDISYYPMSMATRGSQYYYLARSGQRTLYFCIASLTPDKKYYLKPVTDWMK